MRELALEVVHCRGVHKIGLLPVSCQKFCQHVRVILQDLPVDEFSHLLAAETSEKMDITTSLHRLGIDFGRRHTPKMAEGQKTIQCVSVKRRKETCLVGGKLFPLEIKRQL